MLQSCVGRTVQFELKNINSGRGMNYCVRTAAAAANLGPDGRKLVKVGVNFSKETRNIDEYIVVEE